MWTFAKILYFALALSKQSPSQRAHRQSRPGFSSQPDGFTMTELMVVMLLIALLSLLAYPAYSAFSRKARYAEAKQQMGSIARDLEIAFLEQGDFPADTEPNTPPPGVNNWPKDIPYDSTLDYDHWALGGGQCYVQLAFWGEKNQRQYDLHQALANPGEFQESGDNLVLAVAAYGCDQTSPGPIP